MITVGSPVSSAEVIASKAVLVERVRR
jgi:hypothetical protein